MAGIETKPAGVGQGRIVGGYCRVGVASWFSTGIGGESGRKKRLVTDQLRHNDKETCTLVLSVLGT